jgi:hypothetical protein
VGLSELLVRAALGRDPDRAGNRQRGSAEQKGNRFSVLRVSARRRTSQPAFQKAFDRNLSERNRKKNFLTKRDAP